MTRDLSPTARPSGHEAERLIAEHRERIIQLEADGLPSEEADALWDVLREILSNMKRHQALINPGASSEV